MLPFRAHFTFIDVFIEVTLKVVNVTSFLNLYEMCL